MFNPFSLMSVYTWERQNLLLALLPALAVVGLGLIVLARRQRAGRRLDVIGWLTALAGLLFISTGATVLSQMIIALTHSPADGMVIITLIFASLPIFLGGLTLRLALGQRGRLFRLWLALLGVLALVFWAGFVVGPLLALAAAVLPQANQRAAPAPATAAPARAAGL